MKTLKMIKLIPGFLLALPLISFAQHKHVHGEAELTIAFEKQSVVIEFKSPSANLLGFESTPQNAKEIEAVKTVNALLADYTSLVALSGGNCTQTSYNIEGGVEDHMESHDEHDHHKEHKEHAHDEKHKHHDKHDHQDHDDEHKEHGHHAEHKGHDEHKDHDEHSEEVHSDFYVSYALNCNDVTTITALEVTGFKAFAGLEEVDVDWVTARQQGSSAVKAGSSTVAIKH